MNALTRKALTDVTRRKGRTLLAILGIMIGVLGLTAVHEATNLLSEAFFYTTDAGAAPDITVTVDHLPTAVATTIQHLPNVAIMQVRTTYMTLWSPAGQREPVNIEIDSDQDGQQLPLGAFQLTSGRMPGPGEIVMDTGTEALLPVALDDTVKVGALDGQPVALRVVGLARTRGLAVWHSPAFAIAYMRADALQASRASRSNMERCLVGVLTLFLARFGEAGSPSIVHQGPGERRAVSIVTRTWSQEHTGISHVSLLKRG